MAVLPVIEVPDPRLRLVSRPIDAIDADLRAFIADLTETMYAAKGIGLAAIQVGVDRRVLVIDLQEERDAEDKPVRAAHAYINPEVLWESDELSTYSEGCLSIPEQYAEVARPARCRVGWTDQGGERQEAEMDGLLATCMQHEIDHLNGVLFTDHLSRLKRDMVMKKLAKLRKAAA